MTAARTWGFSTLGLPRATPADIVRISRRAGFDAVELRVADDEPLSMRTPARERSRWRSTLSAEGVRILSVNSYLRAAQDAPGLAGDLDATIDLAHDLGAEGVRLFVGDEPHGGGEMSAGERRCVELLCSASAAADQAELDLLVETHGSHSTAARLRPLLDALTGPTERRRVRVIWDTVHSWAAGEPFKTTRELLGDRVAWVQVKDVRSRHDPSPVPLGAGSFPVAECRSAIDDAFTVVLEWERRWHPELPSLESAAAEMRMWFE